MAPVPRYVRSAAARTPASLSDRVTVIPFDAGITGLIPEASLHLFADGRFTTSAQVLPVGTRVSVRVHSFRDGKVQFSVMKPRTA